MRQLLMGLTFALMTMAAPVAMAADYVRPTPASVVQALVRFGALDPRDDKVIDEYGRITECSLFSFFNKNDFKWEKVRAALRQSIDQNIATFPTGFFVKGRLYLDRYDFKEKMYKLGIDTGIRNVNALALTRMVIDDCEKEPAKFMPQSFQAVLDSPVTVEGLYMPEEQANDLLKRMTESGNTLREVWAKFNIHITYIERLPLEERNTQASQFKIETKLDNVEFYEDKEMTKLIYTYER